MAWHGIVCMYVRTICGGLELSTNPDHPQLQNAEHWQSGQASRRAGGGVGGLVRGPGAAAVAAIRSQISHTILV